MRLRPIEPQYECEDLKQIDPSEFEANPTIPEKEQEPQLIENQVHMHIIQNGMVLPRTNPGTRTVALNSYVETTNISQQEASTTFEHMNHEPISDQEAFFVEGSVPLAHAQTPEKIDTENYIFSGQSNFPQTDARFGVNRPCTIRRRDHLALARENSVNNTLQPKQEEEPAITVITYFHLDHYIKPEVQMGAENDDSDETENQSNRHRQST